MQDGKNPNSPQGGEANFEAQTSEQIRESVISDFGLDAENQGELIDKIVNQRSGEQKKFAQTIADLNKRLQGSAPTNPPKPTPNAENTRSDEEWRAEVEFIAANRQWDKEDIDQLKVIAKGLGKGLAEASEHDLFKGYIETKKAKEIKEKAELGASGRPTNSSKAVPTGDKWKGYAEKRRDELIGQINK